MVPSSHCAVLTLNVIVFLSHSVVPLFFFLIFYGTILTLRSIKITCGCIFVTFGNSFIFSHIWWYYLHIVQYQHHMWLYLFHIWWFSYFFSSHLMVPFSHYAVPTSHVTVLFSHLMVPSSHCTVLTSHLTIILSYLVVPFFFSFTFDGSIIALCRNGNGLGSGRIFPYRDPTHRPSPHSPNPAHLLNEFFS